jgi:trigger factor
VSLSVLAESLSKYLVDEKLNILGEPLPNEAKPVKIDWDNDTEFEFAFDIGLAPELDEIVSAKDKLPYYEIKVDAEELNKQVDRITSRYGTFVDSDVVSGDNMIKADLIELDSNGSEIENGIKVEEGTISLEFVKDEKIKKQFDGLKKGEEITIDVKKAFENETDLAALLKIDKEKLKEASPIFKLILKNISRFEKAAIDQELFDKAYGKDTLKSEEEFRSKVEEELKSAFGRNSDYKLRLDARAYFLDKFKKDLPVDFLKRWLLVSNQGKVTAEQIEKDFAPFMEDLKWQLIKGKITRDQDLKFTEEELLDHVKEAIRQQFIQYYGVGEVPAELLEKYSKESLSREKERNRHSESLNENKVFDFLKKTVKLDTKEITLEKFNKLFEK